MSVLYRVEAYRAFSTVLLYHTLSRGAFSDPDAGLITDVVLGTLRLRGRLDYALSATLTRPLPSLPLRIQCILRLGLYQILFLDRVPVSAAVDQSVDLARRYGHRGTAGLVNAVLRRLATEGEPPPPDVAVDPLGHLSVVASHPRWLVERWAARLAPEGAAALCAANNAPPPSTLRVNRLRASPAAVAQTLAERGLETTPGLVPEALRVRGSLTRRADLHTAGLVTTQDDAAMMAVHLLDPQPGETVLDAAAAPGGKATHMAERMENRGRVIALDTHAAKLDAVARQAVRLGLDIIEPLQADAREAATTLADVADRVLVDAPCTGTGVIRRRPEIKWRITPETPAQMAVQQRAILGGAAMAVRAGGICVYSVCSLEPEEGEEVVTGFLSDRPDFTQEETLTLMPHVQNTDGFYIARLRRREAA